MPVSSLVGYTAMARSDDQPRDLNPGCAFITNIEVVIIVAVITNVFLRGGPNPKGHRLQGPISLPISLDFT